MTKRKCPQCKKDRWSKTPSWEFAPICLRCRRKNGEPKRAPKKQKIWNSKRSFLAEEQSQPKKKKASGKKGKKGDR